MRRLLLALTALLVASPALAQPLTVAVAPSAPMTVQTPDGRWTGPAITLMREAADATGRPIRFDTLEQALAAQEDGQVDVVAASAGALKSAGSDSPQATTVQIPLQLAARDDAAPFVAEINRLTAAPFWWNQAAEAVDD